jgi:transcriptional regulator with XRE-family HTH domain
VKTRRNNSEAELEGVIARRLKERRVDLGFLQEDVAKALGLSDGQIHQAETNEVRISAARLFRFAAVLGVPFGYFFEGVPQESAEASETRYRLRLEMARAFARLDNAPALQEHVVHLVQQISTQLALRNGHRNGTRNGKK